jgi:hypothetical protein
MAYDTYETKAPWILFRYKRTDRWAMCVGASIRMLCLVCGSIRLVYVPPWKVWFPAWFARKHPNHMHPARAAFLIEHYHVHTNMAPLTWAIPLANPEGYRDWQRDIEIPDGFITT